MELSIFALKNAIRDNDLIDVFSHFQGIFIAKSFAPAKRETQDGGGRCLLIRRANLSVSHIEFNQGIPLLLSRFNDLADEDYILRVQVIDDNNEQLNSLIVPETMDSVKTMLRNKMLNGIHIGGRHYQFLGSSTSQMRERGLIFYAKDCQGRTAEDIRNSAGDLRAFSNNVPKYVARLGLIFSQSMGAYKIQPGDRRLIADIEGDIKPSFGLLSHKYLNLKEERYCFTDGVGIVSESIAREFNKVIVDKNDDNYFPSAYQIRNGGAKGMLTVWPLAERVIAIRESMQKYESDDQSLRILKFSYPRPVFLNRALINILEKMNCLKGSIFNIVKQDLAKVTNAFLSDRAALDLVVCFASSFLPFGRLRNAHVMLLKEPFFRSMIKYLTHFRLSKELKKKSRFRIPWEYGRSAFGVVDETRQLKEGQIFFQYTVVDDEGNPTSETRFLRDNVMITKFPCLEPGDVRIFHACRPPSGVLDHIKDCVVFPAQGRRPHPDMMSGSDLDGDEYAIFWDPAIFIQVDNEAPMNFPSGMNNKKMNGDINDEDIIDFYCDYFILNNMGKVANNHLMFSDLYPNGMKTIECQALALECAISLDFQKSGFFQQTSR